MNKKLLLVSLFFINHFIFSQKENTNNSFYTSFDKIIGIQNTDLSYGTIFREKYIKRKGSHNYLLNDQFTTGKIIYRGDSFFNIKMKYDLVDDIIIINITDNLNNVYIIPEKKLITRFLIHNLKFIHTQQYGFLEEIASKKTFSIYKKHIKTAKENRDRKYVYYTFKKKEKHLLFYKKKYYSINSKRDFIKIFPSNKKLITEFYRKNKFLLKNDFKNFIIKLMNKLFLELKK